MQAPKRTATSALLALCAASPAFAFSPSWSSLDDAVLDGQRGGFVTPQGLQINFSFENIVMVNGQLLAHTVLTLAPGNSPVAAASATAPAVSTSTPSPSVQPVAGTSATDPAVQANAPASANNPTTTAAPGTASAGAENGAAGAGAGSAVVVSTSPGAIAGATAASAVQNASLPSGTNVVSSGLHTVIQNSIDNQHIQHLKVFNVELSNLRALHSMGVSERIRLGVLDALR